MTFTPPFLIALSLVALQAPPEASSSSEAAPAEAAPAEAAAGEASAAEAAPEGTLGEAAPDLLVEPSEAPAPELFIPAPLDAPAAPAVTETAPVVDAREPPKSAAKPKLLVLDLVDQGAGPMATGGLSQAVQGQAVQSYVGEVITTSQLKVALDAAGLQALSGCMSEKCMTDLAGTVEAERILGGSIAKTGDDFIITLLLVEQQTGALVKQEQRKVPAHEDLSYYAAKQLTSLILTGRSTDPLVPVAITASEEGSIVIVDGQHAGTAPVTVQLDPGSHEVRVEKAGFVTWKTVTEVQEATPLGLHAQLVDPGFPLWPFAVSTGVVSVVAAAGGAWFGLSAENAYRGTLPLGDPDDSYLGNPSPTRAFLLDKKQTVRERAVWADVLYGTAALFGAVTVGLFAWELGAAALQEE